MSVPLLNVSDLQAWYGESHVLHGLNLHVNEGEMICILGRNGMGKTTSLRAIMGILRKRTGQIEFGGQDIMALGDFSGPQIGDMLRRVERHWIDGGFVEDRDRLLALARDIAGGGT